MNSTLWMRMHGGTTHFPIALVIASFAFDLAAGLVRDEARRRDLHAAAFYALVLGALGTVGAVVSGVMISGGQLIGDGLLARHHLFLWPASALIVGLAVWRVRTRRCFTRRALGLYLTVAATTAALMTAAGYWGGEMLLGG